MRQVVLDTETTGLSPQHGHRLTEVGCLEIIDRNITGRTYQTYLNPERELDDRAAEITGLTWSKLKDKPKFAQIADDLIEFIGDAELIIHNAPFDLGFLTHEYTLIKHEWVKTLNKLEVIDTLILSREMHPGQRNSLDALCKRYSIDNSHRNYHGALLDAEILAKVYLTMTAGQTVMDLNTSSPQHATRSKSQAPAKARDYALKVIYATQDEQAEHAAMLALLEKQK